MSAVAAFTTSITGFARAFPCWRRVEEALGVRGEHISPLSSLGVPDRADAASVLASEAGALFVARAGEARGELVMDDANATAVRDLCERLDGIPLAIELAAAQTAMMSPAEILTRLEKQFRLLTGGRRVALERHQRCGRRWTGRTTSSATTNGRCSMGCRYALAVSISTGRLQ